MIRFVRLSQFNQTDSTALELDILKHRCRLLLHRLCFEIQSIKTECVKISKFKKISAGQNFNFIASDVIR